MNFGLLDSKVFYLKALECTAKNRPYFDSISSEEIKEYY